MDSFEIVIVFGTASIIILLITLFLGSVMESIAAKENCPEGLVISGVLFFTEHKFYCQGKEMVCNRNECWYVEGLD